MRISLFINIIFRQGEVIDQEQKANQHEQSKVYEVQYTTNSTNLDCVFSFLLRKIVDKP